MLGVANADPRAQLINSHLSRHGLSFRWLATRIETSHVSVSSWLNGEARPRDVTVWGRMLDVLADYEQSLKGDRAIDVKRTGIRQIPVYPGLSAGGLNAVQSDVEMMPVMDWGSDRARWGRVVDGFSMHPMLEPGDIAVFEDRPWEPWHVVHAFDAGEDTVKIARKLGDAVQLLPANPDYPVIDGTQVNIKGVLVQRVRKGPNDETTTTNYPHGMRCRPDWLDAQKAS